MEANAVALSAGDGTGGIIMTGPYFLGIDIGTQGARIVIIDVSGNILASDEEVFLIDDQSMQEQSTATWWQACFNLLEKMTMAVKNSINLEDIKALSVTSTSGTVIPLDENNTPLHKAIMYSDKRSAIEGKLCKALAEKNNAGYTEFNSSSGLSKMVWFVQHFPGKAQRIARWAHAADYITGKLSSAWGVTDHTNALKSGYNVQDGYWPEYIYTDLPVRKAWLPQVVPSGTPIGRLDPFLAAKLGLKASIQVVAGMTDGCASQVASGAVNPGDWNTTIGTTLVIKGVARSAIRDVHGRLYNHRHPEGFWMPGGASNTGADWVSKYFTTGLDDLNEKAKHHLPTGRLAYPLQQRGERFPFIAPDAIGFEPEGLSPAERFTANMEGVAYIERYAYEMIEKLSGETVKAVYTAGGASNSEAWLCIRSNVLNKPIYKMKSVTGAVGAAILAASKTHFTSVIEAAGALTQLEREVYPQKPLSEQYNTFYLMFLEELRRRGYISKEQYA